MLEHLRDVLNESLTHTALMLPFLFLVFLVVETVSHRTTSSKISRAFSQPFLGPVAAAALGLIPQCGFSVIATTLFLEGMIPMGSLLSAYISTSDEALPIMLADRASLPWVVPLLATKLVWGAAAGICINTAIMHRKNSKAKLETDKAQGQVSLRESDMQPPMPGNCGCTCTGRTHTETHGPGCRSSTGGTHSGQAEIASHALSRTLRIASMIFVLSALFNFIGHAAQGRLYGALSRPGLWQPVVAALVGLVPSCATSVALAESFKAGILSFPATLSGLTSNSGLGLLILAKESSRKKDVVTVVALLVFAAVISGFLASTILPAGYLIFK